MLTTKVKARRKRRAFFSVNRGLQEGTGIRGQLIPRLPIGEAGSTHVLLESVLLAKLGQLAIVLPDFGGILPISHASSAVEVVMAVIIGVVLSAQIVLSLHIELDAGIVSTTELNLMEQQVLVQLGQLIGDLIPLLVGGELVKVVVVLQLFAVAEVALLGVLVHDSAALRAAFSGVIVILGKQREVFHRTKISSAHILTRRKNYVVKTTHYY